MHGVESDDVLADEMQVRRPVSGELLLAGVVAAAKSDRGSVVGQCVQPDVDDMVGRAWEWDAPRDGGA